MRTDTKMNIMKTEALSGHSFNVTGVAGQQKPIATNTSQRITGTRARRKGEPMNLNMKSDTALTILRQMLNKCRDTWEHDALVLAIEALKVQDMTLYMNLPEVSAEEVVEILKRNNRIELLPSAQLEHEKGEWIKISPARIYECSKCGKNVMTNDIEAYNFCHGCGADMR